MKIGLELDFFSIKKPLLKCIVMTYHDTCTSLGVYTVTLIALRSLSDSP